MVQMASKWMQMVPMSFQHFHDLQMVHLLDEWGAQMVPFPLQMDLEY